MIPYSEIMSLSPTAIIELFVLDASSIAGGGVYYFHAGTNQVGRDIVWQGQAYQRLPMKADGFEWSSKGTLPRPKITVSNLDGVVGAMIRDLDDLVGAKVTRKRCFARHLDGMPGADPEAHWPDEPWEIDRKTAETDEAIEFELVAPLDVQGSKVPRRLINAGFCNWDPGSSEICPYIAGCKRRLADCKENYPNQALPYGGFPGTRRAA